MEARLVAVGLSLLAWGVAARRWGPRSPAAWTAAFASLCGAGGALLLAPAVLGLEAPGAPSSGEWALAAAGAAFGAFQSRSQAGTGARERLDGAAAWAGSLGPGALAAGLVMAFLIQAFRIPSASMEDTLLVGDRVVVDKAAYGLRLPGGRRLGARPVGRGDVLVFRFPSEDRDELHCTGTQYGKDYLKRAVGVPGDVVEVRDGQLFVGGRPVPSERYVKRTAAAPCASPPSTLPPPEYQRVWEERHLDRELGEGLRDHFGPVTVPRGAYLVLGDNRDGSCDSRFWGPVPERYVKGRAVAVYWPPSRVGFIH